MITMNNYEERLDISYIKLKINIVFQEDTVFVRDKVSALRGGMGEMLLRQNCIRDRDCGNCHFEEACIVRKTVYTQMKRKPPFMQGDDSIGYLIECENYQTRFCQGEGFFFYLVLFGNNLVYFGQYLQAFYQLGNAGIGKYHSHYSISSITNEIGHLLLQGNTVNMENYHIRTVYEYVIKRMNALKKHGCQNKMVFVTPLSLKYQGIYINQFYSEAVFQALFRRIMMLDYFAEKYIEMPVLSDYPVIKEQDAKMCAVKRYSSTQDSKIALRGIKGYIQFEEIPEKYLPHILAGELLHIGKNTSFGFGRYILV